jgi:hypothetical protein
LRIEPVREADVGDLLPEVRRSEWVAYSLEVPA